MAAFMGRTEIEVKKIGVTVTVPDHPIAKLMYYFSCVCSCVEAEHDATINRLKDYKNYRSLTPEEESQLLILCLALTPDNLIGNIFFPNEDLEDCSNEFFELKTVNTRLIVAESLLIGGQQKKVHKIMMFIKKWIEKNYINPMLSILQGQRPTQRRPLAGTTQLSYKPPANDQPNPPQRRPVSRHIATQQPSSRQQATGQQTYPQAYPNPPANGSQTSTQPSPRPPVQSSSRPLGQPIPPQPLPVSRQTSTKPTYRQWRSSRPQAIPGQQTSPQAYPNPPANGSQMSTQPSPGPPAQSSSRPPAQPNSRPPAQPISRSLAQANSRPLAQANSRPLGQPIPSRPVSRQTSTQRPSSRPQATGQQTSSPAYPNPPANGSLTSTQPSPRPPAQPSSRPLAQPNCRPPAQPNYRPLGQPTTRKKKCIIQ